MGKIFIKTVNAAILHQEVLSGLDHPRQGAQACFFGVVRDHHQDRTDVESITYDIFKPLVEKVFHEICTEAQGKGGSDLEIRLIHSFGRLRVSEICVGIAVSAAHRDEAFQACRYIIEQLKVRAPIWKKEHYEIGESQWLKGHALGAGPCSRIDTGGRTIQPDGTE